MNYPIDIIKDTNMNLNNKTIKEIQKQELMNIKKFKRNKNFNPKTNLHSFFTKFRNIHKDKSAYIFATGASLNNYKFKDLNNSILVGLNKIYKRKDIVNKLNYYFFGSEYNNDLDHKTNIDNLPENITKFASVYTYGKHSVSGNIGPESVKNIKNAYAFDKRLDDFSVDISKQPFLGHSIVFPAIQFLLYTGVTKIHLIGCDCDDNYFYGKGQWANPYYHYLNWWINFRDFKNKNYSNVDIISINPIGLKGLFIDEFTCDSE